MTSEVGLDLRAVRPCRRSVSPYVGAFGEIDLPRRRSGKVEFVAGILEGEVGFVAGLRDVAQ